MDEIKAVTIHQKATKGFDPKPTGWIIVNDNTGKRIGLDTRYATREEAEAHIPAAVAALQGRLVAAEDAEAARDAQRDDAARVEAARAYRPVHSPVYGAGRVYRDQPGATQYDDDSSGRYTTQIWDNS